MKIWYCRASFGEYIRGNELWGKLAETKFKLRSWFRPKLPQPSTSLTLNWEKIMHELIPYSVFSLSGKSWKYSLPLWWTSLTYPISQRSRAVVHFILLQHCASTSCWPPQLPPTHPPHPHPSHPHPPHHPTHCSKVNVFGPFWRTVWDPGWHVLRYEGGVGWGGVGDSSCSAIYCFIFPLNIGQWQCCTKMHQDEGKSNQRRQPLESTPCCQWDQVGPSGKDHRPIRLSFQVSKQTQM